MPPRAPASTTAKSRFRSLGATVMPMRPRPSANDGSPCVSGFHVVAAVGRLVQAAARTGPRAVLPRPLPRFPQRGVDRVRRRPDRTRGRPRPCFRRDTGPCEGPSAVRAIGRCRALRSGRTDARARPRTADRRFFGSTTICGICWPSRSPRCVHVRAGVDRLVDAVAGGQVRPLHAFPAARHK